MKYTQQKSSAQVGVRLNPVLIRNDCIKCYISLFKDIISHQFGAFQTEIQGSLTTGTHLLIEIIDASWKANAHYNGICMRRGDCYVCMIHFL